MQIYVILMVVAVVLGTILDMLHKKSAEYFFENAEKAKQSAKRTLGGGEKASLAVATLANEVLTSAEFKVRPARRYSHLLTMYGFIIFVVCTALLIFRHTGEGAGFCINNFNNFMARWCNHVMSWRLLVLVLHSS